MKSDVANNLMKADRRNLKQRAQSRDKMASKFSLTVLGEFEPLNTQDTDYPSGLDKVPLKVRNQQRGTPWPVENRPERVIHQPADRNIGDRVWRRYLNGQLSLDRALSNLRDAIEKWNNGISPLNEIEALMLASVFPEIEFTDMGKKIVELKAKLSATERDTLRKRSPIWPINVPKA